MSLGPERAEPREGDEPSPSTHADRRPGPPDPAASPIRVADLRERVVLSLLLCPESDRDRH